VQKRCVHGSEDGNALRLPEQAAGPGNAIQAMQVDIGSAAIAFPPLKRPGSGP
jgi:hypothetical protein